MCQEASARYDAVMSKFPITPAQSRAARALLEWSQSDLAKASNVGLSTVRGFENTLRFPHFNNLKAMRDALEEAGIELIDETPSETGGVGARFREKAPR